MANRRRGMRDADAWRRFFGFERFIRSVAGIKEPADRAAAAFKSINDLNLKKDGFYIRIPPKRG